MDRHSSFWLGVFSSILIGIPIAIGIVVAIFLRLGDLAVFAFGALIAIISILVFLVVFRDWILNKLVGTAKASLQDVSVSGAKIIGSAAKGEIDEAQEHAANFSRTLIAWYAWVGLYRWVIATGVALLGTFAIFSGTIIIVEQNRTLKESNDRLSEQNKIVFDSARDTRTFDVIRTLSTNEVLLDSRNSINNYVKDRTPIPANLSDSDPRIRQLLNYYEDLSAQANFGYLNSRLVVEVLGNPMVVLHQISEVYIKDKRCEPDSLKLEGTLRSRKIFENFEYFVVCTAEPYFDPDNFGTNVWVENFASCRDNIQKTIYGQDYCS